MIDEYDTLLAKITRRFHKSLRKYVNPKYYRCKATRKAIKKP